MVKNDKLHIPISTEDKEDLKRIAKEQNYTLASFCGHILKGVIKGRYVKRDTEI